MIRLNLISRIAYDKLFFLDFIVLIANLRKCNFDVRLKIIGKIYNTEICELILRTSRILNVAEFVEVTGESRPINQIENSNEDYFVNISVGSFIGYSSIECVSYGLRTIFYNVDEKLIRDTNDNSFCFNFEELLNLLKLICSERNVYFDKLQIENIQTANKFILDEVRIAKLIDILI